MFVNSQSQEVRGERNRGIGEFGWWGGENCQSSSSFQVDVGSREGTKGVRGEVSSEFRGGGWSQRGNERVGLDRKSRGGR